ncbi:MAG: hypothetical protein ACK2UT_21750, partial [Candidatus Promineifilaceae bacterium]
ENAFFVIGDQVLGIQGHPEFTTGIMRDLLNKPKETASSKLMQTARHSLQDGRPDNELFAQWIVNFLNG